MVYNHDTYLESFAKAEGLAFHVAASWRDMLAATQLSASGELPAVVADYDESSQFANVGDDSLLEYRTYSAYFFKRADVGDPTSVPRAKLEARVEADRLIRQLLRDAANRRYGLQNLQRESLSIASLGMVGDWAFGVMVTFTLVGSYVYSE